MAYPFYPTYQPVSYLPAGYQPITQQNTQSVPQNGIIWISGYQEAQMYPVAPNSAVALWEQSGKAIYLKSADSTGKPSLRVYDLVERTDLPSTASGGQDVKMPDYATKDEVSAVAVAVKSILGDIETMKSDLYGMAGRKKISKKAEAEEDDA